MPSSPRRKAARSSSAAPAAPPPPARCYRSLTLCAVAFVDAVVALHSLPTLTLHGSTASFTLGLLALYQASFHVPQVLCTFVAERFALAVSGTRAYAATLLATAVSVGVTALALHVESLKLYMLARVMSGLCRHASCLGAIAEHELPESSTKGKMRLASGLGAVAAMLIGGLMGDIAPSAAAAAAVMAAVEFANAGVVALLSVTATRKPKMLPAVHRAATYRDWLVQLTPRRFGPFVPLLLTVLAACLSQCMYPFSDRRVFHMRFSLIGLHMAAVMGMPFIAPIIVRRYGEKGEGVLMRNYAILLTLGAWIHPWVGQQGDAILYVFATFFLTDLPAAVLDATLSGAAVRGFSASERPLAQKLAFHVKMIIKLWAPVLLTMIQMAFEAMDGRSDGARLIASPAALGVVAFGYTRHVPAALIVFVTAMIALASTPPIDDERMWANALEPIRSFVAGLLGPSTR